MRSLLVYAARITITLLHLRTLVTMLSEEGAQTKEVIYYRTGVVRFYNLNKAS